MIDFDNDNCCTAVLPLLTVGSKPFESHFELTLNVTAEPPAACA